MIKLSLTGHIGKDAELKQSQNGKTYCKFSVAVTETKKQDKTTWVSCILFGNLATAIHQYLVKGTKVYVDGKPTFSPYIGTDQTPQSGVSIEVKEIELIGERKKSEQAHTMSEFMSGPLGFTSNDDIPF